MTNHFEDSPTSVVMESSSSSSSPSLSSPLIQNRWVLAAPPQLVSKKKGPSPSPSPKECPPTSTTSSNTSSSSDDDNDANKYGYGDAVPDSDKYGCRAAVPDMQSYTKQQYGYGDRGAAPDSDNGYGDTAPATRRSSMKGGRRSSLENSSSFRAPRRSSLKLQGAPRRASISYTGEVENNLPGQETPLRRRTSITWKDTVAVRKVPFIYQLTDQPEALWFQKNEYKQIRRNSLGIVYKMKNGQVPEGKKYCIRGLESLSSTYQEGKARRRSSLEFVLKTQEMQRDSQTFDDESLKSSYEQSVKESQKEAELRAKQDEEEVKSYMRSTRTMMRRLSC